MSINERQQVVLDCYEIPVDPSQGAVEGTRSRVQAAMSLFDELLNELPEALAVRIRHRFTKELHRMLFDYHCGLLRIKTSRNEKSTKTHEERKAARESFDEQAEAVTAAFGLSE